jgi:hypothetical protein
MAIGKKEEICILKTRYILKDMNEGSKVKWNMKELVQLFPIKIIFKYKYFLMIFLYPIDQTTDEKNCLLLSSSWLGSFFLVEINTQNQKPKP